MELRVGGGGMEGFLLTVIILVTVHAGLLRRGPARRVHPRGYLLPLLPVHHQRDRVFCPGHAAQSLGNAPASARGHPRRPEPLRAYHTVANVDVVRVQVVRDVGVAARPGLEGLELRLRLRHVRVEIVEVAEGAGGSSVARVGVRGVEALVVLDVDEDVVFAGGFEKGKVVGEELSRGLRDQHVVAPFDGVEGDGEVGGVGGEDGDGAALREVIDGLFVGIGVGGGVGGIGGETDVEVVVDLGDVFLEVVADGGEFGPRDPDHAQSADFASSAQVEECQAYYADFFVGGGGAATDEASGVLAGADHEDGEGGHNGDRRSERSSIHRLTCLRSEWCELGTQRLVLSCEDCVLVGSFVVGCWKE